MMTVFELPLEKMITFSPVSKKLEILRHTTKLGGGDLLNKQVLYFALIGQAKEEISIAFETKSVLTVTEITPPIWVTLNGTKGEEDLDSENPGRNKLKLTRGQSISRFVAAAATELDVLNPIEVFFKVKATAKGIGEDLEDPTGNTTTSITRKTLLTSLWVAN